MRQILDFVVEADPLAIYAAATATLALFFSAVGAFNNFFDRPWLRIRASIHRDKHQPDKRTVIVTVLNVGRRKASFYSPAVKVADRKLTRFLALEPDEFWADGQGWYPNDDKHLGYPEKPCILNEYDSAVYSFDIDPEYDPLLVTLADTLQRRKRLVLGAGRLRYPFYAAKFWLRPYKRKKAKPAAA